MGEQLNISNSISEYVVEINEITEKICDLPTSYASFNKENIFKRLFNPSSVDDLLDAEVVLNFKNLFQEELDRKYQQLKRTYLTKYIDARDDCNENLFHLTQKLAMQVLKRRNIILYNRLQSNIERIDPKELLQKKEASIKSYMQKGFLHDISPNLKNLESCGAFYASIERFDNSFPFSFGRDEKRLYTVMENANDSDEINIHCGNWEDVKDKSEINKIIYDTIKNYKKAIDNYNSYIDAISKSLETFQTMYQTILQTCDYVYNYRDSLFHLRQSSNLKDVLTNIASNLFNTSDIVSEIKACNQQLITLAQTASELAILN